MNTSPSLAGQSAVAAMPGAGESHVGDGVEVDNVSDELIVVEVADPSEDVDVVISEKEVENERSLEVVVEVEDSSSEDVEVTRSEVEVEDERSLEVVAVACSSSRSSTSTVEVVASEVEVATISVVLDWSVNAVDDTSNDEVVDVGSHVGPGDTC